MGVVGVYNSGAASLTSPHRVGACTPITNAFLFRTTSFQGDYAPTTNLPPPGGTSHYWRNMTVQTDLQTAQVITLGNAVETFLDTELLGLSSQTVTWYRARLRLFVAALGADRDLGTVTEHDLIVWYRALEARANDDPPNLSFDTMHGYVRAVRRLLKWLYERHVTITEMWPVLKLPTLPEQERKGVDDANVISLIDAARQTSVRDYAILMFIEATGARRGGVSSLKLKDININAPEPHCRRVTVHEKGRHIRKVFLSPDALAALCAWLDVRKSKTEFVFVDERPGHDAGLKPGAISQIILRYKTRLGITGRCSPHQWRHGFARVRLIDKVPLNLVSQMLGHKSVVVTAQFYGNLLVDELQNVYDEHYKKPTETA